MYYLEKFQSKCLNDFIYIAEPVKIDICWFPAFIMRKLRLKLYFSEIFPSVGLQASANSTHRDIFRLFVIVLELVSNINDF
jgi:hypothetical protein